MTPKTYQFLRDGVPEDVAYERWRWEAYYHDGGGIKQFDDDGVTFHQFKEIDQSKVQVFALVHDTLPAIGILLNEGDKLIHGYRITGIDFMGAHERVKVYVFGVERDGVKNINVVMPTDEIIQTDDVNKVMIA